ncbi:GntR family transcriptional regulator [Mesorhizobium sp. M1423]|uniref:GntR family transcriptional regulator n=1 Tax=Mesorhizobium sp. M1423 TaxID=2957101 RepID=UPI003338A2CE
MARPKLIRRPAPQMEVTRRSLDAQAADKLRDAILTGVFAPGEKLTEEVIAESFGLSRGTIRASLRLLVHEGLIVQEPYRGYSVRSLTSRDAWELFTLRNTLEAFAARLLAETITEEKRDRLDQAYDKVVKAVTSGVRTRAVEADFQLHLTIAELTEHSALQAHYALIAGQVRLYQSLVSKFLSLQDYIVTHESLIAAMREGRAGEAERLAAEHNTADGERLVEWLREAEGRSEDRIRGGSVGLFVS